MPYMLIHLCPPSPVCNQIRAFKTSEMEVGADRAEPNVHVHSDPTLGCEEVTGSLNHGDS